jgi:hypothetical protein
MANKKRLNKRIKSSLDGDNEHRWVVQQLFYETLVFHLTDVDLWFSISATLYKRSYHPLQLTYQTQTVLHDKGC